MAPDRENDISGIASLDQPTRRALYDHVAKQDGWVGRDDAASALDLPRSVAAFHLDKLAEAGLVEVKFERPEGRGGPGAGRPAKLYRRSDAETAASVPERRYDLAGSLLAGAVATAERTGAPVAECLGEIARAAGADLGARVADMAEDRDGGADGDDGLEPVLRALERSGYVPVVHTDGEIALRNCPFHRLAQQERVLVCGMNLDFLTGCLDGLGVDDLDARLDPEPGYCCVRIARPAGDAPS